VASNKSLKKYNKIKKISLKKELLSGIGGAFGIEAPFGSTHLKKTIRQKEITNIK
jgi:hypothetical protein